MHARCEGSKPQCTHVFSHGRHWLAWSASMRLMGAPLSAAAGAAHLLLGVAAEPGNRVPTMGNDGRTV